MTLKELSRLYRLNREIEEERERLYRLRELFEKPSGAPLSTMHGGGVVNRTERYIALIDELERRIAENICEALAERIRLEKYISSIPESYIRQIFRLRFVDGRSWNAVARKMGGGNTASSVKMACYRYIKSSNE